MDLLVSLIQQYKRGGRERFLDTNKAPALVVRLASEPNETWNDFGTDTLPHDLVDAELTQTPSEVRALRRAEGLWVLKIEKSPLNRPNNLITLGRGRDCDMVLNDSNISRTHACFNLQASGDTTLTDLNSRNGTRLNGRRLTPDEPAILAPSDVITLGQIETSYETPQTLCQLITEMIGRKSGPL